MVTPLGNTLTITGYNAATGVVSYTYTLGAAETHASGAGENSLFENFPVTLTDTTATSTPTRCRSTSSTTFRRRATTRSTNWWRARR